MRRYRRHNRDNASNGDTDRQPAADPRGQPQNPTSAGGVASASQRPLLVSQQGSSQQQGAGVPPPRPHRTWRRFEDPSTPTQMSYNVGQGPAPQQAQPQPVVDTLSWKTVDNIGRRARHERMDQALVNLRERNSQGREGRAAVQVPTQPAPTQPVPTQPVPSSSGPTRMNMPFHPRNAFNVTGGSKPQSEVPNIPRPESWTLGPWQGSDPSQRPYWDPEYEEDDSEESSSPEPSGPHRQEARRQGGRR